MEEMKKHNHLYPAFHVRKWKSLKGKIYDKEADESRDIDEYDFSHEYYYSLGKKDDTLENRIQVFESYIGTVIKEIDQSNQSIYLTGKDVEILKLYCALSALRQHHTSEVILSDQSGFYQSNNYIFGVRRVTTQEEAVSSTRQVMDDFEKLKSMPKDKQFCQTHRIIDTNKMGSALTVGTHLCIIRSGEPNIMVSDRCSIIENTMDGDHLYTYVPVSPTSALLLVKTKYYLDDKEYFDAKKRLSEKYGAINPDKYMSVIFGNSSRTNHEDALFCSYYKYKSNVHVENNMYIKSPFYRNAYVKITKLPSYIFNQFNAIFYQDGKKIIYIKDKDLEKAKTAYLGYREISLEPFI